ncbi:DUF6216 family protein [Pseudomonas lijiangensis]|uniref:DUF6216 family protein n=1 Tax=Pseudomonas lijiangensis TaxID=2995658 RepID=UPI0034D71485
MTDTPPQQHMIENAVSLLKDISPWFMTIVTGFFIVWAIFRARSAHFLLDKIWRLVGGGAINDPELKKEWLLVRDLEGFRFRTGINFNTRATWNKTLKWLEQNDKSLNDLSFARAWMLEKPWNFKAPWIVPINIFAFLIFLIFGSLTMSMAYIFSEPSALLTIKGSEKTFWTDGVNARDFKPAWNTPKFTADITTCKTKKIDGFDEKDATIICSSLEPSTLPQIKNAIKEQKIFSAYIAFLCILALIFAARYAARAKMAKKFSELPYPRIT